MSNTATLTRTVTAIPTTLPERPAFVEMPKVGPVTVGDQVFRTVKVNTIYTYDGSATIGYSLELPARKGTTAAERRKAAEAITLDAATERQVLAAVYFDAAYELFCHLRDTELKLARGEQVHGFRLERRDRDVARLAALTIRSYALTLTGAKGQMADRLIDGGFIATPADLDMVLSSLS